MKQETRPRLEELGAGSRYSLARIRSRRSITQAKSRSRKNKDRMLKWRRRTDQDSPLQETGRKNSSRHLLTCSMDTR